MNKHLLLVFALTQPILAAVPEIISRPATENLTMLSPGIGDKSAQPIQGGYFINPANAPKASGIHLTEFRFGHSFETYVEPHSQYTEEVLAAVYGVLYPTGYSTNAITGNRAAIEASGAAFRYKYLIYGNDGSGGGELAILNLYETSNNSAGWFTETDRQNVIDQIGVLREALAQDPLNVTLQNTFLETYYDWAVAEVLESKRKLSKLARLRLGLEALDPGEFIIDVEIETNRELVAIMRSVLDVYAELLSTELDGINPSDFDPNAGNAPFG